MTDSPDPRDVAAALRVALGGLVRRLRQGAAPDDLTLPEAAALGRLDRGGETSPAELARLERISPQSIGATLSALERRRLVARRPDEADGRRVLVSISESGRRALHARRALRTEVMARALEGFAGEELATLLAAAPLIERLSDRL